MYNNNHSDTFDLNTTGVDSDDEFHDCAREFGMSLPNLDVLVLIYC